MTNATRSHHGHPVSIPTRRLFSAAYDPGGGPVPNAIQSGTPNSTSANTKSRIAAVLRFHSGCGGSYTAIRPPGYQSLGTIVDEAKTPRLAAHDVKRPR